MNTEQQITEFTIDRSKWARGGRNGPANMLNEDGSMCCLGIFAKACGVPDEHQLRCMYPGGVANGLREKAQPVPLPSWLVALEGWRYGTTEAGRGLAIVNDDRQISEEAREAEIAKLFAAQGVTVHFEGAQ